MNFEEMVRREFGGSNPEVGDVIDIQELVSTKVRQRVRQRHRLGRRLSLVVLVAVSIIGIIIEPRAYALYQFSRMAAMARSAQTVEIKTLIVHPDGKETLMAKFEGDHGKWRVQNGTFTRITENGVTWFYDQSKRTVYKRWANDAESREALTLFGSESFFQMLTGVGWQHRIEVDSLRVHGRLYDRFISPTSDRQQRFVFLIYPGSGKLAEVWSENRDHDRWTHTTTLRFRFNLKFQPSEFATNFPMAVKILDDRAELDAWQEGLEKSIATFSVKDRTISIREITANPRGHLFMLYTDGTTIVDYESEQKALIEAPRDDQWHPLKGVRGPRIVTSFEVNDSTGQPYRSGYFSAFDSVRGVRRGVALKDHQILKGAWLIPQKYARFVPGKFKIKSTTTFSDPEYITGIPGTNGGGMFKQPRESIANQIELTIRTSAKQLEPVWMSQTASEHLGDRYILQVEADLREPYLESTGDYKGATALLGKQLAVIDRKVDLGYHISRAYVYYRLYNVLKMDHQHARALKFLKLASHESVEHVGGIDLDIRNSMREEGIP